MFCLSDVVVDGGSRESTEELQEERQERAMERQSLTAEADLVSTTGRVVLWLLLLLLLLLLFDDI